MPDGLYRCVIYYAVAAFVVEGGTVTRCAPILRRWTRTAPTWSERRGGRSGRHGSRSAQRFCGREVCVDSVGGKREKPTFVRST